MTREYELNSWLQEVCPAITSLTPLPREASFRHYFRVQTPSKSFVLMDAPPDRESTVAFVQIATRLLRSGLRAPLVIAANQHQGFLLLEDLGDKQLYSQINKENFHNLYSLALDDLIKLRTSIHFSDYPLEKFDEKYLLNELQQFEYWFLRKHLQISMTETVQKTLATTFMLLVENATNQPQTIIHRDYHSRNLMCLNEHELGILDFQDAMIGPITYDLVSLLRDCYISWSTEDILNLVIRDYQQLRQKKLMPDTISEAQFLRWFDLMGLQRHLKALFIFARKFHRDDNPNYLKEIPRTFNYAVSTAAHYPELVPLAEFLAQVSLKETELPI